MFECLSSTSAGLTSAEVAVRLVRYGPNLLRPGRKRVLLLQFLSKFLNPLVLILLATSFVLALTGDVTSFIIISVTVLISVTLDFVQEHKAGQAAES